MVVDTGIFIEHLRAKDKLSTSLYKISESTDLYISAVSLYELYMGAINLEKEKDVTAITDGFTILPFTDAVAREAARQYHLLRLKNQMIDFKDIFIASTCLVYELPMITLNKKHFDRISGLEISTLAS